MFSFRGIIYPLGIVSREERAAGSASASLVADITQVRGFPSDF